MTLSAYHPLIVTPVISLPPLTRQRASDSVYERSAGRNPLPLVRTRAAAERPHARGALGVSLTPVKDALTRLEAEALIEIRPRSGTFVTAVSPDDVAEAFDIRCALECLAPRRHWLAPRRRTSGSCARSPTSIGRSRRRTRPAASPRGTEHRVPQAHRRALRQPAAACRCTTAWTRTSRSRASTSGTRDWKTRLDVRSAPSTSRSPTRSRAAMRGAARAALRHHILRAAESLVPDLRSLDADPAAPRPQETSHHR